MQPNDEAGPSCLAASIFGVSYGEITYAVPVLRISKVSTIEAGDWHGITFELVNFK
jgi:hypothetical protein